MLNENLSHVLLLSTLFLVASFPIPVFSESEVSTSAPFKQPSFQQQQAVTPLLGVGVTYLGGEVRYHFLNEWAAEVRYLTGKASSETGEVSSQVYGLRGYRFISPVGVYRLYIGAELAMVNSDQKGTVYQADGVAAGGFLGFEYNVARNIYLGFDIGPYMFSLKEKQTKVTDSSLEFVVNSSLIFYLF